jgi:hypothetical protein
MGRLRRSIIPALLFLLVGATAHAQDTITIHGFVESDNRVTIEGISEFIFNENSLGLAFEAFPSQSVRLLGSLQFDAIGVDERTADEDRLSIAEEQSRTTTDPLRVELDEAYMMISGLGFRNLDVRIGKQRISWGTGDQFNPTDVLNPDDFHDPLQFGKKTASPAVKLDYFAGPVTLTAVYLPLFYPALLPRTDIRPIFEKQFETLAGDFDISTGDARTDTIINELMLDALKGAELGNIDVTNLLPPRTPSSSGGAFKIGGTVWRLDLTASYAYVMDDFGVPRNVRMSTVPLSNGLKLVDSVDLTIEQDFPRLHVIGGDFAMNVPFLENGFWGEAAYYIPERFKTEYFLDAGPDINAVLASIAAEEWDDGLVIAEDEPLAENYYKWVFGTDYTFPGAWYANVQYIRGLPTDNTADLQADYVFGGVDKPFFMDVIKTRVFGGVCLQDESWVLYPQVFIYPVDAIELQVGTFFVFGDVDTKFGAFGDHIAFLRAKAFF